VTQKANEFFSSRWGLLLAGIGMAVGTGNIWRPPRIPGKHGGSAFLVAWLLALFLWSIPLMMAEMVIGREARKGPVGALRRFAGERRTWLGAWVAFVTLAIMCYYSVVSGWCLRYFTYFTAGVIPASPAEADTLWQSFTSTPWQTVLFHLLAIGAAGLVVVRGVQDGIERANKVLLPLLFAMPVGHVVRALPLPGAWGGVEYLFHFDGAALRKASTWLEAFSQSAWSTGAGWGLLLTFAVYADTKQSKPAADCTIIGIANNTASILAALVVIPTVFALSATTADAQAVLGQGNLGLAFTSLASLFGRLTAGRLLGSAFFLCLFVAALTSLISMVELGVRTLMDFGLDRRRSVLATSILGFVFGIPSALSLTVFNNQDWVWGVGLLVSGAFIALAVVIHGVESCADLAFPPESTVDRRLWTLAITRLIPVIFVVLTGWWLYQGSTWETGVAWWHPIAVYTPGTVLAQWLLVGGLLFAANGLLVEHLKAGDAPATPLPPHP